MYRSLILIALILLSHRMSEATWRQVAQMNEPVGCGYFFDADNGLIGSGQFDYGISPPYYQIHIWRTANGGTTWTQCTTPSGQGRVTSIYMKDVLTGYASIYSDNYTLWKTVDGGKTWFDISNNQDGFSVCVYATSKAIIKTSWTNNGTPNAGGFSVNDGKTFDNTFYSRFNRTSINGIDFIDDLNGVAMSGPSAIPNCYFTTDGGLTWQRGASVDESWGIYADKTTKTFFALPEGAGNRPTTTVRSTTDIGRNWKTVYDFQSRNFTGHIAGKTTYLYVQSDDNGLYRSDNAGVTWKSVGGPDGTRDTRFVVTGCQGEVVYAFNNQGGVFKTSDGGDGTLKSTAAGSGKLTISPDTVRINTFYCQPEYGYITLSVPPCSLFSADSVFIVSGKKEFRSDSTKKFFVDEYSSVKVPIRFQFDTSATRTGKIHLKGTLNGRAIDTILTVIGKNATAPEPYIGKMSSVTAGDTVRIPVYLKATQDTFTISRFTLHLSYNTNILSCDNFDVVGTLATPVKDANFVNDANGVTFTCEMQNSITKNSDLTKPLIWFVMQTYLSSELTTSVRLDTLSVGSQPPQPLCTIPQQLFEIKYLCGDSALSRFMKDSSLPQVFSIYPNPIGEGNAFSIDVYLPVEALSFVEVVDMRGNMMLRNEEKAFSRGTHRIELNVRSLPPGSYIARLHSAGNAVISRNFVVVR